eukprot:Platyproteum_vivax@DN7116_c0_g1_i1.p1
MEMYYTLERPVCDPPSCCDIEIIWRHGSPKKVELACSWSVPPWGTKSRLNFCPRDKLFWIILRTNSTRNPYPATSGKCYFKFVVDGEWRIDPQQPVESDGSGNVNNFLMIEDEEEPPPREVVEGGLTHEGIMTPDASMVSSFHHVEGVQSLRNIRYHNTTTRVFDESSSGAILEGATSPSLPRPVSAIGLSDREELSNLAERLYRITSINTWPQEVTEHLLPAETVIGLQLHEERVSAGLQLFGEGITFAGPEKTDGLAEDAFFMVNGSGSDGGAMGVADGVGELRDYGLDPRMFADELMVGCEKAYRTLIDTGDLYCDSSASPTNVSVQSTAAGNTPVSSGNTPVSANSPEPVIEATDVEAPKEEERETAERVEDKPKVETAANGETVAPPKTPAAKEKLQLLSEDGSASTQLNGRFTIGEKARGLLSAGYAATSSFGSSTAVAACLNQAGTTLGVANLGDSCLLVLRRAKHFNFTCIKRTREQQHQFNCPYQLALFPAESHYPQLEAKGLGALVKLLKKNRQQSKQDMPSEADVYEIDLQEGDLLIMGSDGVFDNIFDHEVCGLCSLTMSPSEALVMGDADLAMSPSRVAETVARAARHRSRDCRARTPFSRHARQNGVFFLGGKTDDITVVASWVLAPQTLSAWRALKASQEAAKEARALAIGDTMIQELLVETVRESIIEVEEMNATKSDIDPEEIETERLSNSDRMSIRMGQSATSELSNSFVLPESIPNSPELSKPAEGPGGGTIGLVDLSGLGGGALDVEPAEETTRVVERVGETKTVESEVDSPVSRRSKDRYSEDRYGREENFNELRDLQVLEGKEVVMRNGDMTDL